MPDERPGPRFLDPTGRFSDRAADYVRARPDYPVAAVDAILAGLGPPDRLVAADVGAGTGIASRRLAERGVRVLAVEPNRAMREAATPHPLVTWVEATAERTGLPSASVGLVVSAQAFHWFEPEAALAEFLRILAPGGRVALLWNDRDDVPGATRDYGRVVRAVATEVPARLPLDPPLPRLGAAGFERAREAAFGNEQVLDAAGLLRRALSASYVPKAGPGLERLVSGLEEVHARHADAAGLVRLAYVTRVYLAERPAAAAAR